MASQGPPIDRSSFRVAIVCALPLEANAVSLLFDHFWDRERGPYGRAYGDTNHYITGRIGGHDVVLAVLPNMGTNSAAAATASLRSSYTGLHLALLVGICGGVPRIANFDACLGDVVVSKAIVQYDYGRRYPGHFDVKNNVEDSLGRANKDIRALLAGFETEFMRKWLKDDASKYLKDLQEAANKEQRQANYQYPGTNEDKLYPTTYVHRHQEGCSVCDDPNAFCESASKAACAETGCDSAHLTGRERLEEDVPGGGFRPKVFIGRIGSGNTVMKSGADRDQIAAHHNLIAFEMEGAGAWDEVPSIVVKGICDYADSHKNKVWQDFAAATAAAVAKAILGQYAAHNGHQGLIQKNDYYQENSHIINGKALESCYCIPFTKNKRFTGRTAVLNALEDVFFDQDQTQRMALVGLGGVGKTQIALRFAYRIKEERPEYSIFWVPVLSAETAERAYGDMAKKLGLRKSSEDEDVKDLVCQHLSSDKAGKWLLIIDNADEEELMFGSAEKPGLEEYLPQNENGITLLTTRSGQVANDFAQADVIYIEKMDQEEATNLFEKSLVQKHLLRDKVATGELLAYLTFLPLAITQAAAYLNQNRAPIQTYLGLLRNAEKENMRILETEFRDNTRYKNSQNAVGTTWIVSFHQIQRSNHLAIDILSFISCIEPKAISQSILPDAKPFELEEAIGILCSYSFLSRREEGDMLDMHSLVHTATQAWLEKLGRERQVLKDAICHFAATFPTTNDAHYGSRREYLPHAIRLLNQNHKDEVVEVYELFKKVGGSFNADRRFKEAIRCFEEVCRWKQGCHPETDHDRLSSEHALGGAYLDDRRIEDAIKIFKHVVKIRKKTLDEKDQNRLASEHELASAYHSDRRIKDAIKIFEHVLEVRKETLNEKDHDRLASEHELARAYLSDRRTKDAIKIFEHVVKVKKDTMDEKDLARLASEQGLASAYLNDRRIKDAIEILEHVVKVKKDILDEKDHSRLDSEQELARAYLNNRRTKDAIKIFEHVVKVKKDTMDEKDHCRLDSERGLARAYLNNQRIRDAIEIFEHVVEVQKETLNEKDHCRLDLEHDLASAYLNNRRTKDAIKIFEHVVKVKKDTMDEKDYCRLSSEYALARAYLNNQRIKDAIKIFEHVVKVTKETLDEKEHNRLASEHELARAYLSDRRIKEAIEILEHVVAIKAEILAENDSGRQLSVDLLQDCFKRLEVASDNKDV